MKVVIDTNVLVAGIFWSGPPYTILQAWQTKKFRNYTRPFKNILKYLQKSLDRFFVLILDFFRLVQKNLAKAS